MPLSIYIFLLFKRNGWAWASLKNDVIVGQKTEKPLERRGVVPSLVRKKAHLVIKKRKMKNFGAFRESNSGPLAPLDQMPWTVNGI